MKVLGFLQSFIKGNDLFSSIQFLRLNKKSKIATIEGGLASIGIFVVICVSLLSSIVETMQKSNISYVQTISNTKDTVFSKISTGGDDQNFMFAIRLSTMTHTVIDLTTSQRYFDFYLNAVTMKNGIIAGFASYPFEPCTMEHWKAFPSISADFDELEMSKWICPPLDKKFGLSGGLTSKTSESLNVQIVACNNATNAYNACYSQDEIDNAFALNGNFYLNFFFTNPIFNLQNVNYIDYELCQKGIFALSQKVGSFSSISISDFSITTDTSILPFTSYQTISGLMLDEDLIYRSTEYTPSSGYLILFINKSSSSYSYNRIVQKLGTIISYIGGLFGIFYSVMAFMNLFTDKYYMILMIKRVFSPLKDSQVGKFCQSFNIFKCVYLQIAEVVHWVFSKDQSGWIQELKHLEEQIEAQLDVSLFVQRITKLERLMLSLVSEKEIAQCFEQQPVVCVKTFKEIREKLGITNNGGKDYHEEEQISVENQAQTHKKSDQVIKKASRKITLNSRLFEIQPFQDESSYENSELSFANQAEQRIKESRFVKKLKRLQFYDKRCRQALTINQNSINQDENMISSDSRAKEGEKTEIPCTFSDEF